MKKIFLLIILFPASYIVAVAQEKVRLNFYGTYTFQDHVESYYSSNEYFEGEISDGVSWGGGIEYFMRPNYGLELSYQRMSTNAPIHYQVYPFGAEFEDFDFNMNYIMLGGNRYMVKNDGQLEGYFSLMAGMCVMDIGSPSSGNSESSTKFSWGAKLGANIWVSERVGIKLQTQLLSVVQGASGGIFFGTSGAGAGVSAYSTIYQFGLGAGLAFKMGAGGAAE